MANSAACSKRSPAESAVSHTICGKHDKYDKMALVLHLIRAEAFYNGSFTLEEHLEAGRQEKYWKRGEITKEEFEYQNATIDERHTEALARWHDARAEEARIVLEHLKETGEVIRAVATNDTRYDWITGRSGSEILQCLGMINPFKKQQERKRKANSAMLRELLREDSDTWETEEEWTEHVGTVVYTPKTKNKDSKTKSKGNVSEMYQRMSDLNTVFSAMNPFGKRNLEELAGQGIKPTTIPYRRF